MALTASSVRHVSSVHACRRTGSSESLKPSLLSELRESCRVSARERLDMTRFPVARPTERAGRPSARRAQQRKPPPRAEAPSGRPHYGTATNDHESGAERVILRAPLMPRKYRPLSPKERDRGTSRILRRGELPRRSSMGSLLRSEPMTLIQIIEAKGAARNVVNTLGDLGAVQFRDVRQHLPRTTPHP